MGARYLADTNTIIDLVVGRLSAAGSTWLEQQLTQQTVSISVVTRIELLTKTEPAAEHAIMQAFVQSVEVLPLDEPTTQQTIRLRQQHRVKLPDAIIAATALAHGLPLITRNTKDFQNIAGITVINLHDVIQPPSSISIQDDTVLILQGENGSCYLIRIAELDEIRGNIESGLSEWTMQLLDKTWTSPAVLYELAVLTQKLKPDNKINWRNTFVVVEKKNYLEKAGEILHMADEQGKKGSAFGELLKMIKLGQEEQNDETNTKILEIVNGKLMEHGLPVKT